MQARDLLLVTLKELVVLEGLGLDDELAQRVSVLAEGKDGGGVDGSQLLFLLHC